MTRIALTLAAALVAGTAFAGSDTDLTLDTVLGTSEAEVSATLQAMGYTVRKIEQEHGKVEAYFVKDKTMGEVYVDVATGKPTKLSMK